MKLKYLLRFCNIWPFYVPNVLTTIRLFSPAFLSIQVYFNSSFHLIFASFVFFSITDFLDGMLARKYSVVSDYGACMDQISDKLLVVFVTMFMILKHRVNFYIATFLVLREVFISGLREFYASGGLKINVSYIGKSKTFVQMLGLSCLFFEEFVMFGNILLGIAAALGFVSMVEYATLAMSVKKNIAN